MSETTLAWWLADTTRECFSSEDALDVYAVLGAGETYAAVHQILQIAVQKKHVLPGNLLVALGRWLDSYVGEPHEQTIRRYLWRLMCV
jgi:phage gpG-like protein